jgi:hypothetical protein
VWRQRAVDVAPQRLCEHANEVLAVTRRHPVTSARRGCGTRGSVEGRG